MTDPLANYVADLGDLLWNRAEEAVAASDDFDRGRLMGLYEAVSLMKDQCSAFGLDPARVGLAGRDPDSLLTGKQ